MSSSSTVFMVGPTALPGPPPCLPRCQAPNSAPAGAWNCEKERKLTLCLPASLQRTAKVIRLLGLVTAAWLCLLAVLRANKSPGIAIKATEQKSILSDGLVATKGHNQSRWQATGNQAKALEKRCHLALLTQAIKVAKEDLVGIRSYAVPGEKKEENEPIQVAVQRNEPSKQINPKSYPFQGLNWDLGQPSCCPSGSMTDYPTVGGESDGQGGHIRNI